MDEPVSKKFSRLGFGCSPRDLIFPILALAAGSLLGSGCADPFGSCESRRTCPPSEAEAGAGDTGGAAGHSGESGAGGFDGGASGAAGAGGAEAGGAGPDEGGAGGLGEEPCQEGERACRTLGTGELHVCEEGNWVEYDCPGQRVCNLVNALCVPIAPGCEERTPEEAFCEEATRAVCSADLSSITREPCEAGCQAGSCIVPTCGNGEVELGEECDDGNADPADGCTDVCEWGPQQVVLGEASSCAIFGNGAAKCWGANQAGQLGTRDMENRGDDPNEMGENLPFIRVGDEVGNFSTLDIGGAFACGVAEQILEPEEGPVTVNTTYCWGDNSYGALGIRSPEVGPFLEPQEVWELGYETTSVTIGLHFACALSIDVYCWGRGVYGVLGDGSTLNHPFPLARQLDDFAVSLEAGRQHVCAALRSGAVACWGRGDHGQLGTGTASAYGDHPLEINSPPPAELGPGVVVEQIALGAYHSCALTSAGLKCWGHNHAGQLGYGNSGGDVDIIGDSLAELGQSLPLVPVTTASDPIVQIRQMHSSSCALMRSGTLKCWGVAYDPDVGNLAQPALVAAIGSIGDAPNELSQLAPIDFGPGVSVRSFDTGRDHGCALLDSGEIKCWGSNHAGQLGLGHTNDIGANAADLGAALQAVQLR